MNENQLRNLVNYEEKQSFKGWDFSHLDGRWKSDILPWDYRKIVLDYLDSDFRLLDMGTGGGEFLLTLKHPYNLTSVTEAYEPNIRLCIEKLTPLGIVVKRIYSDNRLPFDDNSFDMVINRHEEFDEYEVVRVLKQGGIFVTQQTGGRNNNNLSAFLIEDFKPRFPKHDLAHNAVMIKKAGFEIIQSQECFSSLHFFDIGALTYYAKIIEWEFPNFSVKKCFDGLVKAQKIIEETGEICGTQHRFLIVAKKLKGE